MLTTISGTGSSVFKVEDYSKGLIFMNVRKDSTIKVDLVSKTGKDKNVFPQLTFEQYAQMFASLTQRDQILEHDGTGYQTLPFIFSLVGSLPLTEHEYYKVTLGNLNNRTIEVHNIDSLFVANMSRAIQVDRHDIDASRSEKQLSSVGYAMAFFPNEKPLKIETQSDNRKVTFGQKQIEMFNNENRIVEAFDDREKGVVTFERGTTDLSFPIMQTTALTIHKGDKDMIFYMLSI